MADFAKARVKLMEPVTVKVQPWKELDDSGLVASFLAGEKRAFNELVARYHVRLLNFKNDNKKGPLSASRAGPSATLPGRF